MSRRLFDRFGIAVGGVVLILGAVPAAIAAPPDNRPFSAGFNPLFGSPGSVGSPANYTYPQPGVYGGMTFNPFGTPGIPFVGQSPGVIRFPREEPTDVARFEVKLPADARLLVNNQPTKQSGAVRQFVSPKTLVPGQTYQYTFRAQWGQDGQTVTRERTVKFQAGEAVTVDLTKP
jgi:uncharacterized protein (TIGR03000 family)